MGFQKGNQLRRRDNDEEPLFWVDQELAEPWEVYAYCAGCQDHGATVALSRLDHVVNVPPEARMEVGRMLVGSVGCPMPGPSHAKVVLRWVRMESVPVNTEIAA